MTTANLELRVKSSGAQQATKELDALSRAAGNVTRYSGALEAAAKRLGISNEAMAAKVANAGKAVSGASQPTVVLTSNMDRASKSAKTFADTLTRRFLIGVLVSQLRNVTREVVALNAALAQTDFIAKQSGTSGGLLQGLMGAAGESGISPSQFLDAFDKLNLQVQEAKRGGGDLLTLFNTYHIPLTTASDAFLQVADLITRARDETAKLNILQSAGLPATSQFLKLMQQGSSEILKQADGVKKVSDYQLQRAAELDQAFNKLWSNFTQYSKQAVVSSFDFLKKVLDAAVEARKSPGATSNVVRNLMRQFDPADETAGLNTSIPASQIAAAPIPPLQFKPINQPSGAKLPGGIDDIQTIAQRNQRIAQSIGLLGNLATVTQLVTAKEAELYNADPAHVLLSKQQTQAILDETRAQAEATVASAKLSLGLASETDIRKIVVAGLPPAVRAMGEFTEATRKQTEQLATNNAVMASALPGLKQLELSSASVRTQLDTLGQGITNGISSPLVDLASGATKAGDAFKQMGLNVIRSIEQMIVNMTIAAPIARGLMSIFSGFLPGAGAGAVGGTGLSTTVTGGLYHTGGIAGSHTSSREVDASLFFGAPRYHGGGIAGLMPDEVPAILRKGEPIFKSMDDARAKVGGGTSVSISIGNITMPQDPNGNDPGGERRAGAVAKALEGTVRNIVKDEMIRGQKPRGILNRASSI